MKTSDNTFDSIIIGSGIGALTTASILSQLKKQKVLVLEQHFKAGGFTHIFKRKGEYGSYKWDVGLHYVGNMGKDEMPRAIFDFITKGQVKWSRMPENYDTYINPDYTFKVRAGKKNFVNDLTKDFPNEKSAIEKYFSDLDKASAWLTKYNIKNALPSFLEPIANLLLHKSIDYSQVTLLEYLDNNFTDEKLKSVLSAQWGDYGLPPSKVSFVVHAMIVNHYIDGGYYPVNGAKAIADSIIPIIENAGGKVLLNSDVKEIIVKDWKAVGVKVKVKNSDEPNLFYADSIASNAGAYTTYTKLLPEKYRDKYRSNFSKPFEWTSHVNLFLGLKESAEKLGIKGENLWIFNSHDHNKMYNETSYNFSGELNTVYASFSGLKDIESDGRSLELVSFVPYDAFEKWKDQPWKNRDEEYQEFKTKISESMIDMVEKHLPGFKNLIDYKELSTPLSTEYFITSKKGSIYGIPATPDRYKNPLINSRTPIKNLYLTGADTSAGHGIVGAMMGGVLTAGIILGNWGIIKIFRHAMKYHKSINAKSVSTYNSIFSNGSVGR